MTILTLEDFLSQVETFSVSKVSKNKKVNYINIPCSFDIEATSTYIDGKEVAFMYTWQVDIDGINTVQRHWCEFKQFIETIHKHFNTDINNRFVIYIHNFSYEFQFIRKHFNWNQVFLMDNREPLYAVTDTGIEFRCSLKLSGTALKDLKLKNKSLTKKVGDLDYDKVRHSETPLTDKELGYCISDVEVLTQYIKEQMDICGDIAHIPYTKTGFVRERCRKAMIASEEDLKLVQSFTLEAEEYELLRKTYQGGFTHSNYIWSGIECENVTSYDFTSSYPAVMCSSYVPMSKGRRVKIKDKRNLLYYLDKYCCMMKIKLKGLRARDNVYENPISSSKCENIKELIKMKNLTDDNYIYEVNNGRVVNACEVIINITEIDFKIINSFYEYDELVILDFWYYKRGYLPKPIIEMVLKLYSDKTTLKNVVGRELDYTLAKEDLNSTYGMMVTSIDKDILTYDDDTYSSQKCDLEDVVNKYNKSKKRFLFYPWGVWITSRARYNLFTGIYEFGIDYIYSDTDSLKGHNAEKHIDYINAYNKSIQEQIKAVLNHYNLDVSLACPKTIEDVEKPLGVWDFDGYYKKFKTVGAKRYLTETEDGNFHLTVAGVSKIKARDYLVSHYKTSERIFEAFKDDLEIPYEHTGKLIHKYLDDRFIGEVRDYLGNVCEVDELSSVHFSKCAFNMSLTNDYLQFIGMCKIKEVE